uniref:Conserved oligomeric Golgi complex subunit 8 n=1 Tax=Tetraselmis sp. GSL018 TaxID=582737 RepID=A0A061RI15_9CHLO
MLEASEETIRPGRHQAQWGNGQDEPHKFQDADQDNAYLTELLSYSLDRLNKEPSLLLEDQSCIRRMMQDCAASHHSAFMEATKSLADVRDHMGSVNTHLRGMLEALPSLEEACASFSESSGQVVKRRQSHKQLQANHPQLLELLEVPQLMDTCVRNSNFDEALDLEAFVSKLAFLHPELKVVKGLHDEVKRISSAMRQQLLKRLSGSIQLPECLRIIGYLRRMSALTEPQLRLEFLRCREQWLAEQVSELDTQNPYDFLKKLTDIHRLHLFDIVMQHKAIFSDDTTANPEAHVAADAIILSSWAHHRVTQYLEALKAHLPRIKEGSSLSSVLEHSMYCGMSLGRVGLDFRPLLPPIFESCVANLFTMSLGNALDCFHAALEKHKWIAMPSVPSSIKRTSSKGSSAGSERSGAVPRDGDSEPSEDLSLAAGAHGAPTARGVCQRAAAGVQRAAALHPAGAAHARGAVAAGRAPGRVLRAVAHARDAGRRGVGAPGLRVCLLHHGRRRVPLHRFLLRAAVPRKLGHG